jgi:uncharacterized coiled-coil DUF342 family protein
MSDFDTTQNVSAVLKELSDIKSSLAVNTNETANIKGSISEIKSDIKDIKADVVTRREFNDTVNTLRKESGEAVTDIRKSLSDAKKLMWGAISAVGIVLLNAILKLVIKQ